MRRLWRGLLLEGEGDGAREGDGENKRGLSNGSGVDT